MTSSTHDHYSDAWRIYATFLEAHFADALDAHRRAHPTGYVSVGSVHVASENLKNPQPGYFLAYTDVLGFSEGVTCGSDSLPDFYGWALVCAARHREVQVYVLSDTCFAACTRGDLLFSFAASYADRLQGDGILHQTLIGFGTFVERRPHQTIAPSNFLGTQVVGTAIVDAVELGKTHPLGSRILVSGAALAETSEAVRQSILHLSNGEREYIPERAPQFDLFDCIYYCLCLRGHARDSRPYQHYIWSLASRAKRLGIGLATVAVGLAGQSDHTLQTEDVVASVNDVLRAYSYPGTDEPT